MIVPNSNLISGVVRNRVRNDRIGRVLVSIPVPRASDPDKVAEIMRTSALAHREVMSEPGTAGAVQEGRPRTPSNSTSSASSTTSTRRAASRAISTSISSGPCVGTGMGLPAPERASPNPKSLPEEKPKAADEDEGLTLLTDKIARMTRIIRPQRPRPCSVGLLDPAATRVQTPSFYLPMARADARWMRPWPAT